MIISGLEDIKRILRPNALFKNKAKWAFLLHCVTFYCFMT